MSAGSPVAAYTSGRPGAWCSGRRGVWWPRLELWVDRLVLTDQDAPPPEVHTYPLVPSPGLSIGAVHGQVDADGVAHVLITGGDGDVITQASIARGVDQDRAHLVLATLVAAVGLASDPTSAFDALATDRVVEALAEQAWLEGWSLDSHYLPATVVRVLGL